MSDEVEIERSNTVLMIFGIGLIMTVVSLLAMLICGTLHFQNATMVSTFFTTIGLFMVSQTLIYKPNFKAETRKEQWIYWIKFYGPIISVPMIFLGLSLTTIVSIAYPALYLMEAGCVILMISNTVIVFSR